MKRISKIGVLLLVVALLGLNGCATNRGVVSLQLPKSTNAVQPNGKDVFIESVVDERVFEEKPKTQDIPSLGFGGSAAATADIKKRAIARKRNSFGQALGDILLEEGQTVETVIAGALQTAFAESGYTVVNSKDKVTPDTVLVKATIQKFWAYMTPGFWALTLSSDISTKLEIKSHGDIEKTVSVHSDGSYQVATEGNWMEVIDLSIQKYIAEVKKEI